jgi:hypothetical protein
MENLEFLSRDLLMQLHGPDLDNAIRRLKLQQIQESSKALQKNCLLQGRCPICTLKVPCKHKDKVSIIDESLSREIDDSFTYFKTIKKSFNRKNRDLNIQQPHKIDKIKMSKNCELQRLKFLENLGKFKEMELLKRITNIENEIKNLEKDAKIKRTENIRREKYFKIQKEKIHQYREKLWNMFLDNRSKSEQKIKNSRTDHLTLTPELQNLKILKSPLNLHF